ncbi:MAG: DNA polymerase I [Bacteroidales bacterium]|jgi:DNA polymerase-1|nr:DNA polymerase I [Bacteroidales bacterium]
MPKKIFLLDAMALIFRAYYAMIRSPRMTSKGLNTSAILGFTNTLYDLLNNEQPTHIAVAFDTGAPTIRHAEYEAYKANRQATPDDIIQSIPYIKQILEAFGISVLAVDGYEADDVIGTAAKKAENDGFQVFMMTPDKDYGQLVSENIKMYRPGKFGQKAEVVGVSEICEKYNLQNPEQFIDILGLWGDASDNIPGVPGVGEVKAKQLVAQFESIENLYLNIREVKNDKLRQTLIEHEEMARLSKRLATIDLDVPVALNFNAMEYKGPNEPLLRAVFQELEFTSLTRRILGDNANRSDTKSSNSGSAPDLFSTQDLFSGVDSNAATQDIPTPKLQITLNQKFIEIKSKEELFLQLDFSTLPAIFFEWIQLDHKISGFVFSTTPETAYYHFFEKEKRLYREILYALFNANLLTVTCQAKQSYKNLKQLNIGTTNSFFDIQIAHYLIQPELPHHLENIAEHYLHYSLMSLPLNHNSDTLLRYFGEKIEIYRQLYAILQQDIEIDNLLPLFNDIEMPLTEVLADMEFTGIKLDVAVLQENANVLTADIAHLEEQIFELAGMTFNLASPKQLGEVIFGKLHIIENAKLTKTKQYQTGEEVLVKLVNKHPIIALILEWRTLAKLRSTYIDALPLLVNPKTGRIHTTFNQIVTSTGRLSSNNPNLQNIPIRTERGRDIRKAFVASTPDTLIVAADYSQVELRIVAAVCGDEDMINSFKNGEDIHAAMAAKIYKIAQEEVTPEMRRNAKTVNFGILYGISAFGLADRLHIPNKEARELIETYFLHFPKINNFLEDTLKFAGDNGYVETLLGRRRYIKDITSSNAILRKAAERNAVNAPIQGTAADLIKIAMVNIFKAFRTENLKSKMLLQVHDELVFEVAKDEIETVKKIVNNLMVNAIPLSVPLAIEMKSGKNWFEAH